MREEAYIVMITFPSVFWFPNLEKHIWIVLPSKHQINDNLVVISQRCVWEAFNLVMLQYLWTNQKCCRWSRGLVSNFPHWLLKMLCCGKMNGKLQTISHRDMLKGLWKWLALSSFLIQFKCFESLQFFSGFLITY